MKLVGCVPAHPAPDDPRPVAGRSGHRPPREWTPFATGELHAEPAVAQPIAQAVARVLGDRLPAIARCFADARGMVRAMIPVATHGRVGRPRVGGLGDLVIERCIAGALTGMDAGGVAQAAEIACEVMRGEPAPLRISIDAGYAVIEASAREVRFGERSQPVPADRTPPELPELTLTATALIVLDPDAPAAALELALWWAPAGTTLVAVKAAGGAPVLLGVGASRRRPQPRSDPHRLELRTDRGRLRACVPGRAVPASASLLEPREVDRIIAAAIAACPPCARNVVVGTTGDFVAKDLVATTSAVYRAGHAALSIGGTACEP